MLLESGKEVGREERWRGKEGCFFGFYILCFVMVRSVIVRERSMVSLNLN